MPENLFPTRFVKPANRRGNISMFATRFASILKNRVPRRIALTVP